MFALNEILASTGGRLIRAGRREPVKGVLIDSRLIKPGYVFVAIKGNNFDGHDFIKEAIKKGATCIICAVKSNKFISNHESVNVIGVRDTTEALGDIARFHRRKFNIPVIAVTGSNGKTTTKEMIAAALSCRYRVRKNEGTKNNQIGLPLTLLALDKGDDIAVLEIGTNHFGEVKYLSRICEPNIGVITNIGPCHLEYFQTLSGVFKEKYTLIQNLAKPYLAILNGDDNLLRREALKRTIRPFAITFGINQGSDFSAGGIKAKGRNLEFLVNQKYKFTLGTLGYYNSYNALAAISVARVFGIEYKELIKSLSVFDFPQGRLKFKRIKQAIFLDDSYNSNPLSLRQALNALSNFKTRGRKIFLMGDMLELGKQGKLFHCQAGRQAARVCDIFITTGELAKLAAKAARASGLKKENIFTCLSSAEARDILFNEIKLKKHDVVLVKGSRRMKMEEVLKA